MRYGMPYKGSKNKIAEWVVNQLPKAKHFYDLFGGGGAISHCAVLSGKYEVVHYNELNPLIFKAFEMAVNGEFKNENRWISHEEFLKLRFDDPYVNLCFSFGNDGRSYCYAKKIEQLKKALHYSICFNDFSLLEKLGIFIDKSTSCRLNIIREVKNFIKINRLELQSLERLERLQSLESLESLERLELTNFDYRDVHIEEDSVIYCDIPYKGTNKYGCIFNYEEFYNWSKKQNNIFISEYTMPNEFISVKDIVKTCHISVLNRNKKTIEKVFIPKKKEEEYLSKIGIL